MNIYTIGIGLLLGMLAFTYVNEGNQTTANTANYAAIIQAAEETDDPLLIKEAEVAKEKIVRIQEQRAAIEAEKLDRAENPEKYKEKNKQLWSPLLTLLGVTVVMAIFLSIVGYLTNKQRYG